MPREQFDRLREDLQKAQTTFLEGFAKLRQDYDKSFEERGETMSLESLHNESPDFGLSYCLHEALEQCERVIKEKPGRNIALIKTKIEEALHWLYD